MAIYYPKKNHGEIQKKSPTNPTWQISGFLVGLMASYSTSSPPAPKLTEPKQPLRDNQVCGSKKDII